MEQKWTHHSELHERNYTTVSLYHKAILKDNWEDNSNYSSETSLCFEATVWNENYAFLDEAALRLVNTPYWWCLQATNLILQNNEIWSSTLFCKHHHCIPWFLSCQLHITWVGDAYLSMPPIQTFLLVGNKVISNMIVHSSQPIRALPYNWLGRTDTKLNCWIEVLWPSVGSNVSVLLSTNQKPPISKQLQSHALGFQQDSAKSNNRGLWQSFFLKLVIGIWYDIHSSSKETQLFWTHFSQWPWVTDPDPGSCTFCQMVLRVTCKKPRCDIHHGSLVILTCLSTCHFGLMIKQLKSHCN